MASKKNPLGRKDNIVVQEMNGEVLIYDLKENKAFCLNETSALVWEACDGNRSVGEISRVISQKMEKPANEDLVWLALDQLKKENLLANSSEIVPNFNGMSRREVIRKVGLGTMIALPLVTGLIAPTAAMAQSGFCATPGTRANDSGCTSSLQCASCCCAAAGPNPGTCQGRPLDPTDTTTCLQT